MCFLATGTLNLRGIIKDRSSGLFGIVGANSTRKEFNSEMGQKPANSIWALLGVGRSSGVDVAQFCTDREKLGSPKLCAS